MILDIVKNNKHIQENLYKICRFRLFDYEGNRDEHMIATSHMEYDNTGEEISNSYFMFRDGSVGIVPFGSNKICGIIAENLDDFFSLMIYNSGFVDFLTLDFYDPYEEIFLPENKNLLISLCEVLEDKSFAEIKSETAKMLGLGKDYDMQKLYKSLKKGIESGFDNVNDDDIVFCSFVPDEEMGVLTLADWVNNWIIDIKEGK